MQVKVSRSTSNGIYLGLASIVGLVVVCSLYTKPNMDGPLLDCPECPTAWSASTRGERQSLPQCRAVGELSFEERGVEQLIKDWDRTRLQEL